MKSVSEILGSSGITSTIAGEVGAGVGAWLDFWMQLVRRRRDIRSGRGFMVDGS